ncbi:malate dehydrogenase [Sorangium cellulosum]|uniref:Malate dehydrogenase n=1 Tax=Sorangium cellulosum TaxID=56 RepID=A0A2L0F1G2_SORCE|nr:NAD-dependent malic enzyme [Sorangium cellulosum]AUX45395.1 malate dehydrogenase [Sorangium cellulosum]
MARISKYFDIKRDALGREYMEVYLDGIALLRLVMTNKGTAFTPEERVSLGLDGLLPPQINTMDQQLARVYGGFRREPTPIAKYQYLRALQERNEILFYALLERHLGEMLPIVYTPTVGEAVQQFNFLYQSARGVSFSPLNIDRARRALAGFPWEDVRMIVATDSSAILGIGDQGYGGLAIPIGKLALYTAGGGVSPFHTMPVVLDVGTDRADLIHDPFYLGVRQRRLRGEAYFDFFDRFVDAVKNSCPRAVIQWEDLSKEAAFSVLERYRKVLPSFNDDIQGTGAVTLAGVASACRLRGESIKDQSVVILGAGAGGIGVAWAICQGMIRDGLTEEEALARIFVLDSKGLITKGRPVEEYKRKFAQDPGKIASWKTAGAVPTLLETIQNARATALIGLSGQPRAFSEPMIQAMAENGPRPIIFPLSNPTSSCEALPEEILALTKGSALVATGSPFAPVEIDGKTLPIGQGNNAFIFPGLGFGSILSDAREITDGMVLAAAYALVDYTAEKHLDNGLIYPPVEELQEVSQRVAVAVIRAAFADGVATSAKVDAERAEAYVKARFWRPRYLPVVRG